MVATLYTKFGQKIKVVILYTKQQCSRIEFGK